MFRNHALVAAMAVLCTMFCAIPAHAEDQDRPPVMSQQAYDAAAGNPPVFTVTAEDHHDYLPSLRDALVPNNANVRRTNFEGPIPLPPGSTNQPDGAVQSMTFPTLKAPSASLDFDGVGDGLTGPNGTFSVQYAPPDTDGAIGATQYVSLVNTDLAVFDKTTGVAIYGPVPTNTLWSGFGGGCQTNNDGDGVVIYDRTAGRWVVSQFSVSTTPYLQCVAVSQSSDATGGWYRYSFSYGNTNFPDYPKMGSWPDAYYTTFNVFANGATFSGANLCAYDRSKMLTGAAATQQCFQLSSAYGGVLPSDLDGPTAPPANSPNFLINYGTNKLNLWKFHVNWTTPANSTLTGPTAITVPSFSALCGGGTCVTQPGTNVKLDSLADRMMFRLAYRNFGDHEALVASHSVVAGSKGGVRWYELRSPNTTPVVYQASTFAPDATAYRWMPSIAMDQAGDIALGYSVSTKTTPTVKPSVRYTGRTSTDTLNTMQTEVNVITGAGVQTGSLTRWGDYSAMTVDPVDDCTFWYTNEYIPSNGSFNWKTRIVSFKFPTCGVSSYTIGGGVSGLTASGLVMAVTAGSQTVNVSAGASSYVFPTAEPTGTAYTVSVQTQPTGQTCTVANPTGTIGTSNVTNANVSCTTNTYTIGGSVSGLTASGLVMAVTAGSQTVSVSSGATSYVFPTSEPFGSSYTVSVQTQPTGQTCTVANPTGTIGAGNVTNANVSCTANTYTIGGSVSGLTSSGLVMAVTAGSQTVSVSSGATSYVFPTAEPTGTAYTVSVQTQPTGQTCTVANPTGTIGAGNVTNANVSCTTNTYTIGGSVSGLTSSGLVMAVTAGSQTVSVSSGATSYVFPTAEPTGTAYTVSVQTQPTGQTCTVTNASGTIGTGNITNANVSCTTNTYTIGGSISGLSGTVQLKLDGTTPTSTQTQSFSANGSFTFTTPLQFGSGWTVSVQTQPTGQTCVVSGGSGASLSANVTTVSVTCTTNTFTVTASSGGNGTITPSSQSVNYNATASFTVNPATGYHVASVVGDTCTVTGSGTSYSAANIQANCAVTATFAIDTFTLTYTAGANGTISGTSPQTVSYGGNGSLVTAVPNTGYHFVQWSDGVLTAARTDSNVQANISVTATFAIDTFTLTYTAGANGTISGTSPQTVSYGGNGSLVTAVPNTGYHFVQWSDGVLTAARTDSNVQANISVTATFAIDTFTLTYTAGANGTISGTSPQTVSYGGNGSLVTAVPNTGYHFVQWSDGVMTAARTDSNVQANISVTATFAIDTFTLTYTAGANGTISGTSPQSVNYGGNGSLVTAVPNTGYHFVQWSDGVMTAARTDSNVQANISVTATFAIDTFTLTYTAGANGTISGTSPQTVSYGGNGSLVTAVPNTGYHFVQWSDGVLTAARTDSNVQANISVTATFAIDTFTLTYTAGANGTISGTSPQTVSYGGNGSLVTAVPNTGYHFVQWSDGVLTAARTDSNVQANISVTATFAIDTFTVTFKDWDGSILSSQTVNYGSAATAPSNPTRTGYTFTGWDVPFSNVTANLTVTAQYTIDQFTVTFKDWDGSILSSQTVNYGSAATAPSNPTRTGYTFTGWDVPFSNITANLTVTAQYTIDQFTLTYAAGTGGSINGNSSQTVDYQGNGTAVGAAPDAGYHFVQWSDGITDNPRTDANVTADVDVTAQFAANVLVFTVQPADVAQGSTLGTVEVTEQDGSGNTIVDTATVDLTLVTACGTLDLGSVQMVDGVATLNSSQRFYTLHSGYQITATVTNPNPTPMAAVLSTTFDATASAELVFSDGFESCRP